MSLQQWLANSWLKRITPSAQEVANRLALADRDIKDASLDGISPDNRFRCAYEAIRALADAALHACGYAAPGGQSSQHVRVLSSLKHTLADECPIDLDFLERCRRQRHKTSYEQAGTVQQADADDLLQVAKELQAATITWLRSSHPNLVG